MSDAPGDIVIPDRPSFKAQEVCDLLKLQPYVLRSWENEFGDLGVARAPGAPRVYRRADVELAIRIRHLVFNDGLTLAGVRRRLEAERPKAADEAEPFPALLPAAGPPPAQAAASASVPSAAASSPVARVAIEEAKRALRGVLELLEDRPAARPSAGARPKGSSRARSEDGAHAAAGDLFAPAASSAPEAPQVPAPSAPPPPSTRRRPK
jgi:DNA-binding transcriptional MerR regulator